MPEPARRRSRARAKAAGADRDIVIRRAQVDDAPALARLHADPRVYPGLMQLPFPSVELWRQRVVDNDQPAKFDLHLVALCDGELVGSAGIQPASTALRRRHAWLLGIAVAADWHNQGVGSRLMAALLDYADNWAGALRVELTVFADNEHAQVLYRRFGFEAEGRLRAYAMRDGEYVDVIAMARLRPGAPILGGN